MSLAIWKKARRFSAGEYGVRSVPAERYLMRAYGIRRSEYILLREQQNGQCAICHRENGAICVDHDHGTGQVRGLLCDACNSALGVFGDCIEGLAAAIEYLDNPPANEVLKYDSEASDSVTAGELRAYGKLWAYFDRVKARLRAVASECLKDAS